MGSRDLLRLHKGVILEEGREQTLREGLRRRAKELRTDLAAVQRTGQRLADQLAGDEQQQLARLDDHLAVWRDFCDFLESDFEMGREAFSRLQRFSAIRANALRVIQALSGGTEALTGVAQEMGASFRTTGRRIAPHRCLFHVDGCLAGRWKPAKCANFFCTSEPNILAEIDKAMSFEEFVLANFRVVSDEEVLRAIRVELELGRNYVAPKVLVGAPDELVDSIQQLLESGFELVEVKQEDSLFMLSSQEAYVLLDNLPENMAYLCINRSVDGGALYELAVALDRVRVEGKSVPFYLVIDHLNPPTVLTHPLWADGMMTQPLGALDLYAVE